MYLAAEVSSRFKRLKMFRQVIYSGIQHRGSLDAVERHKLNNIGVAINALDHISNIKHLLQTLSQIDGTIILRLHPGISSLQKFPSQFFSDFSNVSVQFGFNVSQFDFFNSIKLLISSDSSIHLEAALSGVPTFYHNLNSQVYDYYKFVERGLSIDITGLNSDNLIDTIFSENHLASDQKTSVLKDFSYSQGEPFCNKEDEFIAEKLLLIASKDNSYVFNSPNFDKSVFMANCSVI